MKSITMFSLVVLAAITTLVAPPFAVGAAEEPKFENALRFHRAPSGIIAVGENAVWHSADGAAFKLVAQPAGYFSGSVVAGERLVVATSTGLQVFALDGKWKATVLPLEGWGNVLGSNGAKLIALDEDGNQYTLQFDGTWKKEKRYLKGRVTRLVGRGDQWVAVGWEPSDSTDGSDNEPQPKFWASSGLLTWTEIPPDRYEEVKFTIQDLVANKNGLLVCDWKGNVFRSESGARWFKCELPPLKDFYGRSVHAAEDRFYIVESGPNVPTKLRASTTGKEWQEWFVADNLMIRNWVQGAAPDRVFVRDTKTNAHRLARLAEFVKESAPIVVAKPAPVTTPPSAPPPAPAPDPAEAKIVALVAALEKFDKAINSATPSGYPQPMNELLKALRANADATPAVPALGDVFCLAAGKAVEALSGLDGYLKLVLGAPDKDFGVLAKRLPDQKKALLREASGAYAANAAYAQRNQPQIAKGPDPKIVAAQWPVNAPAVIKPQQFAFLDLAVLRRRLVRGDKGAAFDLMIAHQNGVSTAANPMLGSCYFDLFAALAFDPGSSISPTDDKKMKQLADTGSTWAMCHLAQIILEKIPASPQRDKDIVAAVHLLEAAFSGGHIAAGQLLAGIYYNGKVTTVDLDKARSWLERAATLGYAPAKADLARLFAPKLVVKDPNAGGMIEIASKPPTADERRAAAALIEKFERQFLATRDHAQMGAIVAELLNELDPKLPVDHFEIIAHGAFRYVVSVCGFRGTAQYLHTLSPELRDDDLQRFKPEIRALLEKALAAMTAKRLNDPVMNEGEVRLPADTMLLVEPMRSDSFNPAIARERLAGGDAGGALDLMQCYQNGMGTPYDMQLRQFYAHITYAEFSELAALKTEQVTGAYMKRGSAMALTDYALPLLQQAKFKDEEKMKQALEMLVRAMKGGDKRAAQAIEEFKAEHEKNKQALIADIRAQTVGPKGYMRSDVERKAEEIAKAVCEGRFSDVFQAGTPSARHGNRTLWDLLSDIFGTPEQKLGVGYLTPRVEELAKEINPILKERKLVFFGKEVFDATDPAKAEELMNRVLAQAAPPFQDQLRAALDDIKKQNRPIQMGEAIIAAQQVEALRLLRVAERGDWRSIPKGKTAADVVAGNGFDAILDISTGCGITAKSLEPLPAFTEGQIEGAVSLILGGQSFTIRNHVTVNYEHAGGRLQLFGERLLRAAERGKYGKIERQAEMDGTLSFTMNFKADGTLYIVWVFHRGKNGKSVDLFSEIKKSNREPYSQTFVFVPAK